MYMSDHIIFGQISHLEIMHIILLIIVWLTHNCLNNLICFGKKQTTSNVVNFVEDIHEIIRP